MSVEASPLYLTIQWKDVPKSFQIADAEDERIAPRGLRGERPDAGSPYPVMIPATTDDGRIVNLVIVSDEDRSFDIVTQTEAVHRSRNLVSLAIALARTRIQSAAAQPPLAKMLQPR